LATKKFTPIYSIANNNLPNKAVLKQVLNSFVYDQKIINWPAISTTLTKNTKQNN
jgi:SET domain-containing protein